MQLRLPAKMPCCSRSTLSRNLRQTDTNLDLVVSAFDSIRARIHAEDTIPVLPPILGGSRGEGKGRRELWDEGHVWESFGAVFEDDGAVSGLGDWGLGVVCYLGGGN